MKNLISLLILTIASVVLADKLQANWTYQSCANFSASSQGIHFYDANHGAIVGLGSVISFTDNGGLTWQENFEHNLGNFYDLWMLGEQEALIVGEQGLFHTTDFFETLNPIELSAETLSLYDIDATFGKFVIGGESSIYYSDDGFNWTGNIAPQGFEGIAYNKVHCQSNGTVTAVGRSYYPGSESETFEDFLIISSSDLFQTITYGETDLPFVLDPPTDHVNSSIIALDFYSDLIGLAVCESDQGQYFLLTSDGGINWSLQNANPISNQVKDLNMISETRAYMVVREPEYQRAVVYESNDAGSSWNSPFVIPDGATAGDDISLCFVDNQVGYAVAAGTGDFMDVECASVVKYEFGACGNMIQESASAGQVFSFCMDECLLEGATTVSMFPIYSEDTYTDLTSSDLGCFELTPTSTGTLFFQLNPSPTGVMTWLSLDVSGGVGNIEVQANDDYENGPAIPELVLNVLDNDFGENIYISDWTAAGRGTVELLNDNFLYTLFDDLTLGPDSFTYTITDLNGATDSATVYLNWPLSTIYVTENTAMETSVTVIDQFELGDEEAVADWSIPTNGLINFVDGDLVYTPNGGFLGVDSFVASVCDYMFGGCRLYDITVFVGDSSADCDPDVPENCVWPGDCNNDGIANNYDLLNIGLTMNASGPGRAIISQDWEGFYSTDWPESLNGNLNYKYSDCDGNGQVSPSDVSAIQDNYGQVHGKTDGIEDATEDDPVISLQLPEGADFTKGNTIEFSIELGTEEMIAEDIYGLAFTISYDPILIEAGSVALDLSSSWMGDESSLIKLVKEFPNEGEGYLDLAISRTNQMASSGFGTLGIVTFVTDDIIAGKTAEEIVFSLEIDNLKAINAAGEEITLAAQGDSVVGSISNLVPEQAPIELYPNPVDAFLNIENSEGQIRSIQLVNINGSVVLEDNTGSSSLNLSAFAAGLYCLRLETNSGYVLKKLIIK